MNIRGLKCFIGVSEANNLDEAATSLRLSRRTLVRQIQKLEEDTGTPLVSHTPIGIKLTSAGQVLLKHAYEIIESMDSFKTYVKGIGQQEGKQLDIGAYGTALFTVIPEISNAFRKSHSDAMIVVQDLAPFQQMEALRQGHIQIAFGRDLPATHEVKIELVINEPLVVALPEAHELAERPAVDMSDFRNYAMIGSNNVEWLRRVNTWFKSYGFVPRTTPQKAGTCMSSLALVSAGHGMALVPASMRIISFPNVIFRSLSKSAEVTYDLHCAFLKANRSRLLTAMLETVRSYRVTMETLSIDSALPADLERSS